MANIHGSYVVGGFPTQTFGQVPFLPQQELQYLSSATLGEVMELRKQREAVLMARECGGAEETNLEEQAQRMAGLLPPGGVPQKPSLKKRMLELLGELLMLFTRELVGALGRYLPLLVMGYLIYLQLLQVEELLQRLLEKLTGWFEKTAAVNTSAALEVAETAKAAVVEQPKNQLGGW